MASADNKGPLVVRTCIAVTVLAAIAVALRIWARRHRAARLWVDDWMMLGSLPCVCGSLAVTIISVKKGGTGQHLEDVDSDPAILDMALLTLYINSFTYGTALLLAKTSVVAFYARVFPTRTMRHAAIVLVGLGFSWWIIILFVTVFQCSPIEAAFTWSLRWGSHEGVKCFNMNNYFVWNAACNILADVLILIMPVFEVLKLRMSQAQKVLIIGIFLMGLLFTVMSCLRLNSFTELAKAGRDADFTYLIADCWLWTDVEICVGIVSACLPNLAPLLSLIVGEGWLQARSSGQQRTSKSSLPTLVTIGGSSGNGDKNNGGGIMRVGSKRSRADTTGSFERLYDDAASVEDGAMAGLWPKGYRHERRIHCSGSSDFGKMMSGPEGLTGDTTDEIPLNSIAVRKDLEWTETREK